MNPGEPCFLCGVRPDIGCRHRPADEAYKPLVQTEERDGRPRPNAGQGANFRSRKLLVRRKIA